MMEMIELTVKDAVLQALEQARGTRLSGGRLAEQLGVSRAAVHKAIAALRESGLAIDAVTGEGYRLASDDDSLTAAGINALLDTAVIGREILVEPSLTSSNTTMKEQYLGRRHGFTLFAEEQTGGRGRLGRTFVSPADTGVYMTIRCIRHCRCRTSRSSPFRRRSRSCAPLSRPQASRRRSNG